MIEDKRRIVGDQSREAIDALGGYIYQLYQSAFAWIDLKGDDLLFLEVAEDYATLAESVLTGVQVKRTAANITINDSGVVKAIESLFQLADANSKSEVHVRFLTTSDIGLERRIEDRVGGQPTLKAWRSLAKSGDLSELRAVLARSGVSKATKDAIAELSDREFRTKVLRRIHFDCGEPSSEVLRRDLSNALGRVLQENGGRLTQLDAFEALVLRKLLETSAALGQRVLTVLDFSKLIEQVTHVTVRQDDYERLLSKALGYLGGGVSVSDDKTLRVIPDLPPNVLPRGAIAERGLSILGMKGALWLSAATGMGKTMLSRLVANRCGGKWAAISLRNFNEGQTATSLELASNTLSASGIDGLVVDDLDAVREQDTLDALQLLASAANRLDVLLIFTASTPPPSKVAFAIGIEAESSIVVPTFDETEIAELISAQGGDPLIWTKYVYTGSGGGHPQLSEALVRNLRTRGWPLGDFADLQKLLGNNPAVEEVRVDSRKRLLRELAPASLSLLERLSLYAGAFDRASVLAIADTPPPIAQAGLVLDDLVGPWVDQVDATHFQLSPLLSGLGHNSLSADRQRDVHSSIAVHLTRGRTFDVRAISTAAVSALISRNSGVMTKIALAVITSSEKELPLLSNHMMALQYLRTDEVIWPESGQVNAIIRGAQLLLAKGRGDLAAIPQLFDAIVRDIGELGDTLGTKSLEALVYVKLLADGSGAKTSIPQFENILKRLADLLPATEELMAEEGEADTDFLRPGGVTVIGLAFFMQVQGIGELDQLRSIFSFLSMCSPTLRADLLQPLAHAEFEPDMIIRGAWLAEHAAGTIRADKHVELLLDLEKEASGWGVPSIPAACRKFAAVIADEYGQDRDRALAILEEGFRLYGETNSELVRAKAKVHYRAGEHFDSLSLSKNLIEQNEITSSVERAFLGRDAAISAEKQGDFETARTYYLYARNAAFESLLPDMRPMAVGLGADAALAAWHNGDRATCLTNLSAFFAELETVDPKSSLRAAHCRAVGHHILLWLDQEVTGDRRAVANGQPPEIYPGCVSNPDPHKDIGEHARSPVDMGRYMLAKVECLSGVNVGIADSIEDDLIDGTSIEGQTLLIPALLTRAILNGDEIEFFDSLQRQLAWFAYMMARGGIAASFDPLNPTKGRIPPLDPNSRPAVESMGQLYFLAFLTSCILEGNANSFDGALERLNKSDLPPADKDFRLTLLAGQGDDGFNSQLARLLTAAKEELSGTGRLSPTQIWILGLSVVQLLDGVNELRALGEKAAKWMVERWTEVLVSQRFLLTTPAAFERRIEEVIKSDLKSLPKFFELLKATWGTVEFANKSGAMDLLRSLEEKYRNR